MTFLIQMINTRYMKTLEIGAACWPIKEWTLGHGLTFHTQYQDCKIYSLGTGYNRINLT